MRARPLAVGLLGVFFAMNVAHGYVRTTSQSSQTAVAWLESCVTVEPDLRGSMDKMALPIDLIVTTLNRAAQNWMTRTGACSGLTLAVAPATRNLDVGSDGHQAVVFRSDVWARPNGMMHDPRAIGLTTVFYLDSPGAKGDASILDADVELNEVNFTFITQPPAPGDSPRAGTTYADLENTLTHELGHVQGLAHNCWDGVTQPQPVDNGNPPQPVPACAGALPPSITSATMYPYALTPAETSKRNLSPDDQAGICNSYPPSVAAAGCYARVEGGLGACDVSRGPGRARAGAGAARVRASGAGVAGAAIMLSLSALLVFAARRRR